MSELLLDNEKGKNGSESQLTGTQEGRNRDGKISSANCVHITIDSQKGSYNCTGDHQFRRDEEKDSSRIGSEVGNENWDYETGKTGRE